MENNELPAGHQFANFDDLKTFVDFVVRSPMFRAINEDAPQFVRVFSNGDRDFSEAHMPNTIWIANQHWFPSIVLHELAHIVVNDGSHDEDFLYAYLHLIQGFMGAHAHFLYKNAFRREGLIKL